MFILSVKFSNWTIWFTNISCIWLWNSETWLLSVAIWPVHRARFTNQLSSFHFHHRMCACVMTNCLPSHRGLQSWSESSRSTTRSSSPSASSCSATLDTCLGALLLEPEAFSSASSLPSVKQIKTSSEMLKDTDGSIWVFHQCSLIIHPSGMQVTQSLSCDFSVMYVQFCNILFKRKIIPITYKCDEWAPGCCSESLRCSCFKLRQKWKASHANTAWKFQEKPRAWTRRRSRGSCTLLWRTACSPWQGCTLQNKRVST